jgi:hypothetical protein
MSRDPHKTDPGDLERKKEVTVWELEPLDETTGLGSYAIVPVSDAELWGEYEEGDDYSADYEDEEPFDDGDEPQFSLVRGKHDEDCRRVTNEMLTELRDVIGAASLRALHGELLGALRWASNNHAPERGPFLDFARAIARVAWRRTHERITWSALGYEKADQDRRAEAVRNEAALADYLKFVSDQLVAWMSYVHRKPRKWIASNARYQDQVCAVVVRLLELLRSEDPELAFRAYEQVGKPAFYQVRDEVIGEMRRRSRVRTVKTATAPLCATIRRPDQLLLEHQIRQNLGESVIAYLRARLNPRQHRYLDALLVELQLDPRVWGLQERIRIRTARSKARVSEAMAKIKAIAEVGDIDELIRDASTAPPPSAA